MVTRIHRTLTISGFVTVVGTIVLNVGVKNGISRQASQPGSITKKFVLSVDSRSSQSPQQDEKNF
jgi:hypothetical protein